MEFEPTYPDEPTPKELRKAKRKEKMNKIFKPIGRVAGSIIKGVFDTALPGVAKSIKVSDSDLPNDPKKKVDIDFPRLITAITVWIILILVALDKVKFSDVLIFIHKIL